jgi:O-antigen ligase
MAMTGAVSEVSSRAPAIAGFNRPVLSFRVAPAVLLQWALVALMTANLGRIPLVSTGARDASFVLNDVCVVALVSIGIAIAVLRGSLWLDSVGLFALGFAAIGLASDLAAVPRFGLSPEALIVSMAYLVRWLTYFGVYVFVTNNVRPNEVMSVWRTLLRVMLIFTAFGIFQSLFLPGFAQLVYPSSREYIDWDPQGHRLVSTVLDPNLAASMIVLVLLIQLSQISTGVRVKWWQPSLLLVGLVMTLSRGAVIALVAGLIVITAARGLSVRLMRLFAVIVFLSAALIPRLIGFAQAYARFDVGSGSSAATRVGAWLLAFSMISQHPIIGVGFNTYGYVKEQSGLPLLGSSSYASDGGLLFATVMTGFVGLAFYLAMLRSVLGRCRRIWRDQTIDAERRGLAIGVAAGAVAVCVHSLFANSIFTTFVMEILWVTWGLTFVINRDRFEVIHGAE